jgi:hypothetical protein
MLYLSNISPQIFLVFTRSSDVISQPLSHKAVIGFTILLVVVLLLLEWAWIYWIFKVIAHTRRALKAFATVFGFFGLTVLTTLSLGKLYPEMSFQKRVITSFYMVSTPPMIVGLIYVMYFISILLGLLA